MTEPIEVHGLTELIERMHRFPNELKDSVEVTMDAALLTLHENVPPYPVVDNPVRQGTLGRTLGSSMSGGKLGQPDVYSVRELGSGFEARFGTNLEYAPRVIGDDTQAWMHYRWWQMKNIAERARDKINRLFNKLAEKMAAFLEGRGG